jgi:hypothetical protein
MIFENIAIETIINAYENCWIGKLEYCLNNNIISLNDVKYKLSEDSQYVRSLLNELIEKENNKFGWFILFRHSETVIHTTQLGLSNNIVLEKKFVWV